jgi:hypothetical protein
MAIEQAAMVPYPFLPNFELWWKEFIYTVTQLRVENYSRLNRKTILKDI